MLQITIEVFKFELRSSLRTLLEIRCKPLEFVTKFVAKFPPNFPNKECTPKVVNELRNLMMKSQLKLIVKFPKFLQCL